MSAATQNSWAGIFNILHTNGFFHLVWYDKLGIVHSTYLGVSGYNFPPKNVSFCLKILFTFTNSVEPDEMQHYAAFHLRLHCLRKFPLRGFPEYKGLKSDPTFKCLTKYLLRSVIRVSYMKIVFIAEINVFDCQKHDPWMQFSGYQSPKRTFGDQKLGSDDNLKLNFVYKCHLLDVKMCTNHDKVGKLGNKSMIFVFFSIPQLTTSDWLIAQGLYFKSFFYI